MVLVTAHLISQGHSNFYLAYKMATGLINIPHSSEKLVATITLKLTKALKTEVSLAHSNLCLFMSSPTNGRHRPVPLMKRFRDRPAVNTVLQRDWIMREASSQSVTPTPPANHKALMTTELKSNRFPIFPNRPPLSSHV